jgi:transposase
LSRNTVKKYLTILEHLDLDWEAVKVTPDKELNDQFSTTPDESLDERLLVLHRFFEANNKRLRQRGYTRGRLWRLYNSQHPEGYRMTAFYSHHRLWSRRTRPSMHIEHKAGDKVYVDFTGLTLPVVDRETGLVSKQEVFVAVLGASQLTYVEAVASQSVENFIACCENALRYFGGAPHAIVPDNLKSAVTRSNRYEPKLNENFEGFADHYSMTVLPARAYKPKDKALVEGAVKIVYNRIYSGLPRQMATSLEQLNEFIGPLLEAYNAIPMTTREGSRNELFDEIDREALQPLPMYRYEMRHTVMATVMKSSHVYLRQDKHYYSVPHTYISKKVRLVFSLSVVEVYYRYELIASYKRDNKRYAYTTRADHMATQHKVLTDWSPEYFLKKAREIAPEVEHYLGCVLAKPQHPEQSYKTCQGILSFSKRASAERLKNACIRADHFGMYSYRAIEEILKRGLDSIDKDDGATQMPTHENIRGGAYYQQQSSEPTVNQTTTPRQDNTNE